VPRRLTNLLLLGLALGLAGSGLLGWIAPDRSAGVWYELHRLFGAGLLLTLLWKAPIVRGSLGRRLARPALCRSIIPGLLTGLSALVALALGLGWTLGLLEVESFGGYSPLNVHVELGLLLLPLLGWHLSRRWERKPSLARLLVRRRTLTQLGALTVGTLASWRLVDAFVNAETQAGARRASASRHVGSFTGNAFTAEIWQFDRVPLIEAETWRLEVATPAGPLASLSFEQLDGLPPMTLDALLDCTGGWWTAQRWSGWRVDDVLKLAGLPDTGGVDGLAEVVSETGHRWTFPLVELRTMLLATHVGDEPIWPGHGAPVRLVAPGRRGMQWVKWVTRIELLPALGAISTGASSGTGSEHDG
jgi:DMSO/TMAO reductase YedYZ molybdopterin-dependent catalytic subunit